MGTKLRKGKPWMPGYRYSALLPAFSINLLVVDVARSAQFYGEVFEGEVRYYDVDFGAVRVGAAEVMLHADHTHDTHPWHDTLKSGAERGLGAQFRLLGIDPDALAERARQAGAHIAVEPADKGHGWREVLLRDPDGYEWAVGVLIAPSKGPFQPTTDEA